jgi:NAD(P)-dependent dehydrogenase (short-subunit alcohol dehydrogenase family)
MEGILYAAPAMTLHNTSAIVTGGASGMGEATARLLAVEGARVVVVDRDAVKGKAVAAELGGLFCEADVTEDEPVRAAVAAAVEMAPLRTGIHCAGVGWAERTLDRHNNPHDLDRFRKIIEINLIGTFNVLRLAASGMAGNEPDDYGERGVIVNTASVAAYDGQIGQAAYSASKGGVTALTLTAARDLSAVGIRVCTIAPGLIDTPLLGTLPEPQRAALAQSVLFPKRLGTADDFASLALELVRNHYLNGEVIRMDAGIRMPPK